MFNVQLVDRTSPFTGEGDFSTSHNIILQS